MMELFPETISLNDAAASEYNHGFKNPSGGLPAERRRSFRSAIMLAVTGLDALVPVIPLSPAAKMIYPSAAAAMSGNARPVRLNAPAFLSPSCARKVSTAASWYEGRPK